MKRMLVIFVLVALTAVAACSQKTSSAGSSESTAEAAPVPVPSSSALAKVRMGMGKGEVRDAVGPPTDENSYSTGKAFVPFYFGNDARRTSWYYKGQGRVVFADGNAFGGGGTEVIRVDYDPAEDGYPPK